MRILIVDDSRAVHAFLGQLFAETPHALVHVNDGEAALAAIAGDAAGFDLILLDWEMPVLDGPRTLARLRAQGLFLPVVMVTTKNDRASISRALELGATDYVMKPFTKDILFAKLGGIFGQEVV